MMPTRQMVFWALAVVAFALLLWLLREILLPFVFLPMLAFSKAQYLGTGQMPPS